ncbi:hypothetical protein ACSBR1_026120 [Camellia fascicularis]
MSAASLGSTVHALARQEDRQLTDMTYPELGCTGMRPSSVVIEHGERSAPASCAARLLTIEMLQPGYRAPSSVGWQFG